MLVLQHCRFRTIWTHHNAGGSSFCTEVQFPQKGDNHHSGDKSRKTNVSFSFIALVLFLFDLVRLSGEATNSLAVQGDPHGDSEGCQMV